MHFKRYILLTAFIVLGLTSCNMKTTQEKADALELTARNLNVQNTGSEFAKRIESTEGREIEIKLCYRNNSKSVTQNVILGVEYSGNELEYVKGSAMLYGKNYKGGRSIRLTGEGVERIEEPCEPGETLELHFRCLLTGDFGDSGYDRNIKVTGTSLDENGLNSDWAGVFVNPKEFMASYELRLAGGDEWTNSVDALINDKLEFRFQFKNTSLHKLDNVKIQFMGNIIDGLQPEKGSAILINNVNLDGIADVNNDIFSGGLDIGSYEVGEEAVVTFNAVVVQSYNEDSSGVNCPIILQVGDERYKMSTRVDYMTPESSESY